MPQWTYTITVMNNLDRDLELQSFNIPWGKVGQAIPKTIPAGGSGDFKVYSPAGVPSGIEFYFTMRDKLVGQGKHYGAFSVAVDMPFWKYENKSSITCHGFIRQEGFQKVPDGAHDYSTSVSIYLGAEEKVEKPNGAEDAPSDLKAVDPSQDKGMLTDDASPYNHIYDWDKIEGVTVLGDDVSVDELIPEKNIIKPRKAVGRDGKFEIDKKLWNDIRDHAYPNEYSKLNFVKSYFTVALYEIRRNTSFTIARHSSMHKTLEVTRSSTLRRETRSEFQLENTLEASLQKDAFNLSNTLRLQYQISKVEEYCAEESKTIKIELEYDAEDSDRNVVVWDVAKVVALFRKNDKGEIALLGISDYLMDTVLKTYTFTSAQTDGEEPQDSCGDFLNAFLLADDGDEYEEEILEISEDVTADVRGKVRGNDGKVYSFSEVHDGARRRIRVWGNGQNATYEINPNPHSNARYVNGHASKFYERLAQQIVNNIVNNNFPEKIICTALKKDYNLRCI